MAIFVKHLGFLFLGLLFEASNLKNTAQGTWVLDSLSLLQELFCFNCCDSEEMERYEYVKDIGSGNFGVAKLVRDRWTKELFAVKYIERGQKVIQTHLPFGLFKNISALCI